MLVMALAIYSNWLTSMGGHLILEAEPIDTSLVCFFVAIMVLYRSHLHMNSASGDFANEKILSVQVDHRGYELHGLLLFRCKLSIRSIFLFHLVSLVIITNIKLLVWYCITAVCGRFLWCTIQG